jgi:PAS domain S-box-containing protein
MSNFSSKRFDLIEKLKWMAIVRLLGVAALMVIYLSVILLKISSFPLLPFICISLFEAFVNQPYPFIIKRAHHLETLITGHLVLDVLLIAGIIHYLGGIEFSFFNALYPILIIGSAMMLDKKAVFRIATLSSIAYASVIALEFYKILPHTPIMGVNFNGHIQFGVILANMAFFYLIAFLSTYSTNIIEEKDKEIVKAKNFAENLLGIMVESLVIVDDSGKIMKINDEASRISGYSKGEAAGLDLFTAFIPEEHHSRLRKVFNELKMERAVRNLELDLLRKDRSKVPVSMDMVPLNCKLTGQNGIFIVFRDVSPERQAENVKSAFLTNISHELNTPLAVIKGFINTLLEKREIDEAQRMEFLGIMQEESERLARIISDLMDLARMEIGWLKIKKEKGQLLDILKDVSGSFIDEAKKKNLLYHVDLPRRMSPIYFDNANVKRAVTHLLENAFKFTERGEVSIEAEENPDTVQITVRDTGKIINGPELSGIFKMFCNGDGSHPNLSKMNIKLPVIKHIIEAHGGSIWAMSNENQGTRFSFKLPKVAGSSLKEANSGG